MYSNKKLTYDSGYCLGIVSSSAVNHPRTNDLSDNFPFHLRLLLPAPFLGKDVEAEPYYPKHVPR